MILLVALVVSIRKPEVLQAAVGVAPARVISYEGYTDFPLRPGEYAAECVRQEQFPDPIQRGAYWKQAPADVPHPHDAHERKPGLKPWCKSTITYSLSGDIGLLADLALLTQAAALAREVRRSKCVGTRADSPLAKQNFVNRRQVLESWKVRLDIRPRVVADLSFRWGDYFDDVRITQPGPQPGCAPPPANELVACPRTARHWIINSRTAKYHFGKAFHNQYEDTSAKGTRRLKPIFDASRTSLLTTIRPNEQMTTVLALARAELHAYMHDLPLGSSPRNYISVHLRRGDQHALSWTYHTSYVPLTIFVDAITEIWKLLVAKKPATEPVVYIASDSPQAAGELLSMMPATPATWMFSLAHAKNPALRALASRKEYVQAEFDKDSEDERKAGTMGMIVDFALLSGMWAGPEDDVPKGVICTIA